MKTRFFDETGRWYLKIIALLALLVILKMTGCDERHNQKLQDLAPNESFSVREFRHDGHAYLVFQGGHGLDSRHSESCPCRGKAELE
jgi:hypothetical protein